MSDLTALQLIERVIDKSGAINRARTVDHVSAGDPSQVVRGIAVMSQATLEGLAKAGATGANLVFTYDPAFWGTGDSINGLENDALFIQKRDFIRAHNMVVFTLQDHLHDSMPDRIAAGVAQALGWHPDASNLFKRPATTLLALAQELGRKLDDKTLRVVGDPALQVASIATSFGNTAQMPGIALLNTPIDALVCGYAHEWEAVEYCQDMVAAGRKKGMILLGENASINAGMKQVAGWIGTVVTEVPTTFVALPEPYWNP